MGDIRQHQNAGFNMNDDFQLALAQWSLHRGFLGAGLAAVDRAGLDDPRFAVDLRGARRTVLQGRLDPLEFPAIARGLGFDTVEYVNTFYLERLNEPAYFAELKRRADGEGVRNRLIMCDFEGMLGAADTTQRADALDRHRRWIGVAAGLGCTAVRVNAFGDGPPDEVQRRVAESLNRLADAAAPQGMDVLVENHGDLAADADWLVELVRRADHGGVGVLADFGNWSGDRYTSVARVMPWARGVSAKSYDFAPDGRETLLDYERLLRIVRDSGYRGYIAVEYEGARLDEVDGIQATRALVDRILKGRDRQPRPEKKL